MLYLHFEYKLSLVDKKLEMTNKSQSENHKNSFINKPHLGNSILEYSDSRIEYFDKAASHVSPVRLVDPYLPTAIKAYSKPHTKRIDVAILETRPNVLWNNEREKYIKEWSTWIYGTKGRTIKGLVLAERLRKRYNERSISRDGRFQRERERREKGSAVRTTILVVHYFLST